MFITSPTNWQSLWSNYEKENGYLLQSGYRSYPSLSELFYLLFVCGIILQDYLLQINLELNQILFNDRNFSNSYISFTIFLIGSSELGWFILDWCSLDRAGIYFMSCWRCNDLAYIWTGASSWTLTALPLLFGWVKFYIRQRLSEYV